MVPLLLIVLTLLSGALGLQAVSRMVFAGLGITPHSPTWLYTVALYGVLAIAGAAAGLRQWVRVESVLDRRLALISGVLSAVLLGFFWGGQWSYYDPKVALLAGLVAGSVCGGLLMWKPWGLMQVAIAPLGALAAYAFCSMAAITASSLLTTHHPIGLGWLAIAIVYLGLTLSAIAVTARGMQHYIQRHSSKGHDFTVK